jgi:predicted metal-dependent peptidase
MTHKDKINKAKARLMLEHPYFGTLASALKLEKNNELLTFSSDGERMSYNSEYVENLELPEVEFMMANGAMHSVLKHQHRVLGRTNWLWQTATDYVVNGMLVKNGMQAPIYANYEAKFDGMYAEEVYELLRAEMNSDEEYASQDLHEEQIVEVDDANANNLSLQKESIESNETDNIEYDKSENKEESNTTSDTDSLNEELKEHFEQIFQKLKRQGNLPKDLKLLIPEYFSHKVEWREVLYSYIASYAKSTYSFIPPNMKYLYRGIYLPSLSSDLLRIVIAIDTSGSVDESLLAEFLAEVNSIMQIYPNYEIDLITADAKVQSHEVFLPAESLNYEISGGGGTDFRPVFEYIDSYIDYPTLLLYFTDGMGTYPSTDTNYDVLWIMPQEKDVPFGEVVVLDT